MDFDKCLTRLEKICSKLDDEDSQVIEEFVEAYHDADSFEELDEYCDLLLGVADNLDEEDQEIIYQIIKFVQEV